MMNHEKDKLKESKYVKTRSLKRINECKRSFKGDGTHDFELTYPTRFLEYKALRNGLSVDDYYKKATENAIESYKEHLQKERNETTSKKKRYEFFGGVLKVYRCKYCGKLSHEYKSAKEIYEELHGIETDNI